MRVPERLAHENSRDYALRALRENIVSLELEPGCFISENELAAALGLSRTPVREAMMELSRIGMIEIQPQKRSRVALIDYGLVEEAWFVRNLLECAVIELACGLASREDIQRLRENLDLQNLYLARHGWHELIDLDDRFHQALFVIAQKPMAYALMRSMSIHFDRVRDMSVAAVKELKIVADHEAMVNAVAQRDAAHARKLMESHLSRYRVDAKELRARYSAEYFKANTNNIKETEI